MNSCQPVRIYGPVLSHLPVKTAARTDTVNGRADRSRSLNLIRLNASMLSRSKNYSGLRSHPHATGRPHPKDEMRMGLARTFRRTFARGADGVYHARRLIRA